MPDNDTAPGAVDTIKPGEEGDVQIFGGELFNFEGDTDKTDKPVTTEEETKTETEEETEEVKAEEEKSEEEIPESVLGRPRPSYKDITGKYPNFFKDFPEAKHVFFREQRFSELFGDVEDAEAASEAAKDYQFLEDTVSKGDIKTLLEAVKSNSEDNLKNLAYDFLPSLQKLDNDIFLAITSPFIQDIISSAYRDGSAAGNDNLKNSALYVAKYLFGDHRYATGELKVSKPTKAEPKSDPEREALKREREQFNMERGEVFQSDVFSRCLNSVRSEIVKGLDDKGELTDWQKQHLVHDVIEHINKTLDSDEMHRNECNTLWVKAAENGFKKEYSDRLVSKYLSRARPMIAETRRRLKSIALRGKPPAEETDKRKEVTGESRRGGNNNRRPTAAKDVDWRATSDEDFFAGKVTLRK